MGPGPPHGVVVDSLSQVVRNCVVSLSVLALCLLLYIFDLFASSLGAVLFKY